MPTRRAYLLGLSAVGVLVVAPVLMLALLPRARGQSPAPAPAAEPPHNVIIFVADGMRHGVIAPDVAPTFSMIRKEGVDFVNSHSLMPTVTTPNASAIATGHLIGDTGNYSNSLFTGYPTALSGGDATSPVENDPILQELNAHFDGNYLNEQTLLALARLAGYHTAVIGKYGPALIQDVTQANLMGTTGETAGAQAIVIDDATGTRSGVPLPKAFRDRLANDPYFVSTYFENQRLTGDPRTTARGDNGNSGTRVANVAQQKYLIDTVTRAVLPFFTDAMKNDHKPFAMVYWSRDPDGSQHNQGDSPDTIVPGINGPTVQKAIRNADDNLKQLVDYLKVTPDPNAAGRMLWETTDLFITSDHGFATVSRQAMDAQNTPVQSFASQQRYRDVPPGQLPFGFLAIDLAHDLNMPLFDASDEIGRPTTAMVMYRPLKLQGTQGNWAEHPVEGNALIGGGTFSNGGYSASILVSCNGGSDYLYMPQQAAQGKSGEDRAAAVALAKKIVASLVTKQYVSGVFVDTERFGEIPGALSLSDIGLRGSARTPAPAIIVGFRNFSTDPAHPENTGVELGDTGYRQGQGSHGSFGRHVTYNCMMAIGPDFKSQLSDTDPVSNADIAVTLAKVLRLDLLGTAKGQKVGRVMHEAMTGGPAPRGSTRLQKASAAADNGAVTLLVYQTYADEGGQVYPYFDAAGFAGASVGISK